jgi:hypothetical protein
MLDLQKAQGCRNMSSRIRKFAVNQSMRSGDSTFGRRPLARLQTTVQHQGTGTNGMAMTFTTSPICLRFVTIARCCC